MSESKTPRTDATRSYLRHRTEFNKTDHQVWSEHAETLETELAAARAEIAELKAELSGRDSTSEAEMLANAQSAALEAQGITQRVLDERNALHTEVSALKSAAEKYDRNVRLYEAQIKVDGAANERLRGEVAALKADWDSLKITAAQSLDRETTLRERARELEEALTLALSLVQLDDHPCAIEANRKLEASLAKISATLTTKATR